MKIKIRIRPIRQSYWPYWTITERSILVLVYYKSDHQRNVRIIGGYYVKNWMGWLIVVRLNIFTERTFFFF